MKLSHGELKRIVESVLKHHPDARESDNVLYVYVLENLFDSSLNKSAKEFFLSLDESHIPSMASVSRSRRKATELHPGLRGSKYIQRKREELCEEYREEYGHPNVYASVGED